MPKKTVALADRSKQLSEPQSQARRAFHDNMDWVVHMLRYLKLELAALNRRITRLTTSVKKSGRATMSKQQSARLVSRIRLASDRVVFSLEWIPVIVVTIVETYLLDIFISAAGLDESIMDDSKQTIQYEELLKASSLEDLLIEMRRRRARNWIDRTGPRGWIDRLETMGAKGFAPETASQLERLWGTRHVVVHNAGIVTRDFLTNHPSSGAVLGKRVPATLPLQRGWSTAAFDFATTTDAYFITRIPALIAN